MPLGTAIHNIEITLGRGGQLVRAAGAAAELIAKEGRSAALRLPSGEVRLISGNCSATIGQVGNVNANNRTLSKAGSKRWLGKRPRVRGVVMNPVDHPHGGGEGRTPIGRKKPATPWGYTALGGKSRKKNRYSDASILRRPKVAKPYGVPNILAEYIALQLEDRVSFRKTVKKAIDLAEQEDIRGGREMEGRHDAVASQSFKEILLTGETKGREGQGARQRKEF
eukprot:Gb_37512 [translate_table: standard]